MSLAVWPWLAQPAPRTVSEACGVLQPRAQRNPKRSRKAVDDVVLRRLGRGKNDDAGRAAAGDQVAHQLGEQRPVFALAVEQVVRELVDHD